MLAALLRTLHRSSGRTGHRAGLRVGRAAAVRPDAPGTFASNQSGSFQAPHTRDHLVPIGLRHGGRGRRLRRRGGRCHSTVVLHPGCLSVPSCRRLWFREAAVERDVAGSIRAAVQLKDFRGAERLEARADRRWRVIGWDACAAPAQQPSSATAKSSFWGALSSTASVGARPGTSRTGSY
jgi:hypothetical protein